VSKINLSSRGQKRGNERRTSEINLFTKKVFHFKMFKVAENKYNYWSGCKLDPARVELLVKNADEDSKKELFELFYSKTFATVMAKVRHREWAEDLTQEAFIRAFRSLHKLREPKKFGAWLASIAANLACDAFKKEKKYVLTAEPYEKETSASDISVEEHVMQREQSAGMRALLRQLPADQYQVVILFYYYDQKIEDIAGVLNINVGTVKSRLHRARSKLKDLLQKREQNESTESH